MKIQVCVRVKSNIDPEIFTGNRELSNIGIIGNNTQRGRTFTSGNILQCNWKILSNRKPKLIPSQANFPLGNRGQNVSVTTTYIAFITDSQHLSKFTSLSSVFK